MSGKKFLLLFLLVLIASTSFAYRYPRTGYQAELTTYFHNVSGTVTILDPNSIRVDDFNYDGGGPAVYFYLGVDDSSPSFINGLSIGPLLTGTVYTNDTVFVNLPGNETLNDYNAISVWCEDFNANFGSGTFTDPTACNHYLDGDVNDDCVVNLTDFALAAAAWLTDCNANPSDIDCIPK